MIESMSSSGWSVLRLHDFRAFVLARISTVMALQMQSVAMGWFVYDMTKSAWALGFVGLAAFLPAPVLALVTGQVADRYDRRKVIASGYTVACLVSLGMVACVWLQIAEIWPIFLLTMLQGAARAFYMPATQAILPGLLPRDALSGGLALSSSTMQTGTVLGPALGGLLYVLGPDVVFGVGAVCFALGTILILSIKARPPVVAREPITVPHLLGGIHFIKSQPVILGAISLDLFAVLLGGATALLPMFAQDVLHVGPEGLGLLRAAPACGSITMALMLTQWPIRRKAGPLLFGAITLFGVAMIGFGLSTVFWLSMVCLYLSGLADMVSVNIRQSLVQGNTPDAMRGRVSAVTTVFIGASNELGEFESGVLAALVGAVPAVVIGGIGTMLIAALWTRLFPALAARDGLLNEG
jgi:MFS family permease